jgi:hypothetical protein
MVSYSFTVVPRGAMLGRDKDTNLLTQLALIEHAQGGQE